jgi:hypothetical protein
MFRIFPLLAIAGVCVGAPQFLIRNSLPEPHPAVLENEAMEALLPQELKNDFYKNPHIVAALAEPSWFGYKEAQVILTLTHAFLTRTLCCYNLMLNVPVYDFCGFK